METARPTTSSDVVAWLEASFRSLPGSTDDLFNRLWTEGRLQYEDGSRDAVDEYSARLVAAAIVRRSSLFIVLPDHLQRRPALLFATALLRDWFIRYELERQLQPPPRPILYLGATIGIRDQLGRVRVQNRSWDLADVFGSRHLTRRGNESSSSGDSSLPTVYTAYAPAMPADVIDAIRPSWIAIDCADANKAPWLESAVAHARQRGILTIGWGQNPLSECVDPFDSASSVWRWPQRDRSGPGMPIDTAAPTVGLRHALQRSNSTALRPLVMDGGNVGAISSGLASAGAAIYRANSAVNGQLTGDAVSLHRRLLRALELLSVPLELHDSEARFHWGLVPLNRLANDCERFRDACRSVNIEAARHLNDAAASLGKTLQEVQAGGSPLWSTLANSCIEEPAAGDARLIVFQSRAAKKLFLFAMLARFDISNDDLGRIRVRAMDLDDVAREWRLRQSGSDTRRELLRLDPALRWRPLLVGMPGSRARPKLSPLLLHEFCEVLVYPHQQRLVATRLPQIASKLESGDGQLSGVVASLCRRPAPILMDGRTAGIHVVDAVLVDAGARRRDPDSSDLSLWQGGDATAEMAALFADDDDQELDEEEGFVESGTGGDTAQAGGSGEEWCTTAFLLECEGGWNVRFAPDDEVNVVVVGSAGPSVEVRYVRSIRPNERVVLIHGQRRQSLYELIISRVHRDPAIELHLALVRRWQDDFIEAFERWHHEGGTVDSLLQRLQELGSGLVSSLTIRNWLGRKIIAPDNPQDLERLARALGLSFVQEHYKRIDRAASRLRGLHRGLANRLNRWLEQQATGIDPSEDEVFDDELGLRLSDFRDSLLIVAVRSVRELEGPFLRAHLGQVERAPS